MFGNLFIRFFTFFKKVHTWGQMLRSWHETQKSDENQICCAFCVPHLCLMCAYTYSAQNSKVRTFAVPTHPRTLFSDKNSLLWLRLNFCQSAANPKTFDELVSTEPPKCRASTTKNFSAALTKVVMVR